MLVAREARFIILHRDGIPSKRDHHENNAEQMRSSDDSHDIREPRKLVQHTKSLCFKVFSVPIFYISIASSVYFVHYPALSIQKSINKLRSNQRKIQSLMQNTFKCKYR